MNFFFSQNLRADSSARRGAWPGWTRALATAAVFAAPVVSLEAQRTTGVVGGQTAIDSLTPSGLVKSVPIRANGFELFADADLAVGSIRDAGTFQNTITNRGGPGGEAQIGSRISNTQMGVYSNGTRTQIMFEAPFVFGAPPSQFRKIRAVHAGVNNMRGSPGYTVQYQYLVSTPNILRVNPADGQFGNVFSGLAVAFGQGCRDDLNFLREGVSMLPMRDCPATFGSQGFRGKLLVPDSIWRQRFAANPASFRWDDWKIPTSLLDPTGYIGTNSTYGFMSDYNREQKLRYAGVVPGQSGPPSEDGYPLGLELRIDAWNFNSPATRNTQFYQVTVVNRSADVYGTGIDYDSLYFGAAPGFSFSSQNAHSTYVDFSTNTFYSMRAGISGFCGNGRPRLYTNTTIGGCPGPTTPAGAQTAGIYTWTWLKSPLGDMRNKRFTTVGDPFFNPSSPLADDTITFNHSKPNGFGDFSQNLGRSTRAGFGMISSTEDNYLDGRNPSDIAVNQFVYLFTPENWSGTFPSAAEVKFNKFVPGSTTNPVNGLPYGKWDYNNDGIQDTISVPACGSAGCAAVYSDTIAGGYRNNYRNILNTVTAGPFALRAGDTTQFLWAFSFADDTAQVRRNIEGAVNGYLTNYEGPAPILFPNTEVGKSYTVESAELLDSLFAGAAETSIGSRIIIRMPQISAVDPFMTRLIGRIRQDSIAGNPRIRTVLRLNPGLLGRLEARARDNLAEVYVFKSCNNGATFTTTGGNANSCIAAPVASVDAAPSPFPWRPWQRVRYTNGVPDAANVNESVQAGRTYMYSFVTRTRGFRDFQVVDSGATGFVSSNVEAALGIPRDTINSPLAISGPTVINVYAPISNAAGRTFAKVDTATVSGLATQPLGFAAVSNSVSGTTRVIWANRFIVRKTIDTVTNAASTTIAAQYVIPRAATSPTGTVTTNFVAREQIFSANANIPFSNAGTPIAGTFRNVSGSSRVFVDTIASLAGQVGYVWVNGQNQPIFGINNQLGTNQPRDQVGSPLYPGYIVQVRDSLGGSGFAQEELKIQGVLGISLRERNFIIRAPGDTLRGDAATFAPQVRPVNLAGLNQKRTKGGKYELSWNIDPWGPGAPFRLDPIANLQGAVTQSLSSVAAAATTITETSASVGTLVGATAARPLVRVRVPFSMTYQDTDGRRENVRFAMLARPTGSTRLLGTGNDTVRVTIPDTLWMPGDTLFALHRVERDSVVGSGATAFTVVQPETIAGVAGFRPVPVLADSVGLSRFLVSCQATPGTSGVRPAADAATCNPLVILSRGASTTGGYLPVAQGWKQAFDLVRTFDARSVIQLTATPFTSGNAVTKADLAKVSVVPNPYIARSENDELSGRNIEASRIIFTSVPEEGVLRIYSVSGQWLQELKWTKSDLLYQGNDATSGDLPYNLRTREGTELSSGLYFYVLTATGETGKDQVQRGKFVIIR